MDVWRYIGFSRCSFNWKNASFVKGILKSVFNNLVLGVRVFPGKFMDIKCFEILQGDWNIFAVAILPSYGAAIKYGKDDNVAFMNIHRFKEISKRRTIREVPISHPGMKGIPEFIIKDIFTSVLL